jgi:hypothetical protein
VWPEVSGKSKKFIHLIGFRNFDLKSDLSSLEKNTDVCYSSQYSFRGEGVGREFDYRLTFNSQCVMKHLCTYEILFLSKSNVDFTLLFRTLPCSELIFLEFQVVQSLLCPNLPEPTSTATTGARKTVPNCEHLMTHTQTYFGLGLTSRTSSEIIY